MLPRARFDNFKPGLDIYAKMPVQVVVGDLEPKFSGKPKLSIMISTWNRKGQLTRTLECLARQNWKEFEVLVMDDGSTEDLFPLFELFSDYLQLKFFRAERDKWRSCASRAFRTMLPETVGDVICITHPEMMLHPDATYYLYRGCDKEQELMKSTNYYTIALPHRFTGDWYWVSLKPQFLDDRGYGLLDTVDWHESFDNITNLSSYWDMVGFSARPNKAHITWEEYPWWFVGAAKRECPIWDAIPIIDGHAIFDMWLLNFRRIYEIIDVVPNQALCLHQPHLTTAIAPEGEQDQKDFHGGKKDE